MSQRCPPTLSCPLPGRVCCFCCLKSYGGAMPLIATSLVVWLLSLSSYIFPPVLDISCFRAGRLLPSWGGEPHTPFLAHSSLHWSAALAAALYLVAPALGLLANWPDLYSQQGPRMAEPKDWSTLEKRGLINKYKGGIMCVCARARTHARVHVLGACWAKGIEMRR